MRKRYRWNPETQRQEPINEAARTDTLHIMPDIPDFVSPIDGRVIHGRRGLRDHNREHGVTNAADYRDTWAKAEAQRAEERAGKNVDSERRKEHLIRNYENLMRKR